MIVKLLPYKAGSKSAKALSDAVGGKRVRHNGSYKQSRSHLVINYGCSDRDLVNRVTSDLCPQLNCGVDFDGELNVSIAGNKLSAFEILERSLKDSIPPFTTSREEAQNWMADGSTVVCRHLLRASGGRGITIHSEGDLPHVPLYVKYIKKAEEYRVHVFRGEAIDVQQKKRKTDTPDENVNWQVRNHENGFVFCRNDVTLPDGAIDLSIRAVEALHLDFGAVDLIYNRKADKYFVLEVNTAPGLEGTTLENYANAIRRML